MEDACHNPEPFKDAINKVSSNNRLSIFEIISKFLAIVLFHICRPMNNIYAKYDP